VNYIKSVRAENFKGFTFDQPLAPFSYLHGRNMEGKTARVEALALATTRQVPGVDHTKLASDIYETYASGPAMSVYAEDATGQYAGGTWQPGRKKGSVTTDFEGGLELPPMLFSVGEFLGLGPKDRTSFLFRRLPPPDLSLVGPDAVVARLKSVVCDPHTPAHEAAIADYAEAVRADWLDDLRKDEPSPVQEWLERLVAAMAKRKDADVAAAKTMRQTVLGNTALRKDAPALGPVEARLAQARRQAQEALAAEATAAERLAAAKKSLLDTASATINDTNWQNRVDGLESVRAAAAAVPEPPATARAEADAAHTAAVAAEATAQAEQSQALRELEAAEALAAKAVDQSAVQRQIADAEAGLARLRAVPEPGPMPVAVQPKTPRPNNQKEAMDQAAASRRRDTAANAVSHAGEAVQRRQEAVEASKAQTCCPTCGQSIAAQQQRLTAQAEQYLAVAVARKAEADAEFHAAAVAESAAVAVLQAKNAEIAEWDRQRDLEAAQFNAALASWSDLSRKRNAAVAAASRAEAALAALRASLTDTTAQDAQAKLPSLRTAYNAAHDKAAQYNALVLARKARLDDVADAEAAHRTAQKTLRETEAKIAKINADAAEAVAAAARLPGLEQAVRAATESHALAVAKMNAARKAATDAEAAHRLALADAANAAVAQAAEDRAVEAEARAEIGKALMGILDALLKASIAASVGPLVALTNRLCAGILDGVLDFRDGEIVLDAPGGRHGARSMSGLQKKIVYAALAVGLAAGSPVKLVWLDDIGSSVDRARKALLYTRLGEMLRDGVIDQVIVTDTDPWPCDGQEVPGVKYRIVHCQKGVA